MNYGIVGLGKQGKQHLSALLTLARIDNNISIFLCDTDEEYVKKLSSELGLKGYNSCVNLLDNVKIDVLILALPNNKYKEILDIPTLNNISIIKEKPFATTLKEAKLFLQKTKDKSINFNIVQNRYFANHYILAKKWLEYGLIGKILFFEYRYTLNDKKESWYWNLESGGGCWLNIGWHFAFLLSWFFGLPKDIKVNKIKSSKRAWDYGTDDTVFVSCNYNNFTGNAYLSVVDSFSEDIFKIVGDIGTLCISKNDSILFDNNGNVVLKEKAENLLSYIHQIKDIFKDGISDDLLKHNLNAMKIINNNL